MEILHARNWSGLLFLSPGDLPDTGIEPRSPALQVYSLSSESPEKPRENWENRGDIIEIDCGRGRGWEDLGEWH